MMLTACCSRFDLDRRHSAFNTLVKHHHLLCDDITAGGFVLRTAFREGSTDTLRVYIEGDGFGWKNAYEPSTNPTPISPVSLHIALANDIGSWVYLARPCQYTMKPAHACTTDMWTTHIYSAQVIAAISAVIDHYKKRFHPKHLELIGYSGGGTLALLIKAHRTDISTVTTIASNIDVAAWTQSLGLTPLNQGLDPRNYHQKLCGGSYHFVWGGQDSTVSQKVFQPFVRRLSQCADVTQETYAENTHSHGWNNITIKKLK
ncbi:MAG: hypothetical protein H6849_01760 [Alphaproteobacteria bacterium]|nr:MAG: hypothetical protein H6849_01760 [Alphaproteobacteria bacterium]